MKKRLSALVLMLGLLCSLLSAAALADGADIYVSAAGTDAAAGTQDAPVATLSKAVELAPDGATIYVMSDLTSTSCARYYNKHLTVTSLGDTAYTITRGDSFAPLSDAARSWYHPALIEVQGTEGTAGLTLTHLILDDAGKHEGSVFAQASSQEGHGDNTVYVQDAMIASNAAVPCTITLGDGAVLRNFGGMSAIRVTNQARVVMENGSIIEDTTVTDRTKGTAADEVGPAGAIWSQGSEVILEEGSSIQNVVGRAIYMDGGKATVDGVLSGIKSDPQMWNGGSGTAIHLRNHASGTMSGTATGFTGGTMISLDGCAFTLTETGKLLDSVDAGGIGMADTDTLGYNTLQVDGEIARLVGTNGGVNPIHGNSARILLGKTANVHDNCVNYGALYLQGDVDLQLYGKINHNYGSKYGAAIATPDHGHVDIRMYDGAELCGNIANKGGGALQLKNCTFIMDGGKINGNLTKTANGGAAYLRSDAVFLMNGGEISGNYAQGFGGGIAYYANGDANVPVLQLNGGTVSGNYKNAVITTDEDGIVTAESTDFNDVAVAADHFGRPDRFVSIHDSMVLGDRNIYMQKHDFNLENPKKDVQFGNASEAAEAALTAAAAEKGWSSTLLAALWCQDDAAVIDLTVNTLSKTVNSDLPIYALAIATGEDGKPAADAVDVYNVEKLEDGRYHAAIRNASETGYAVALVQPTQDFGTLTVAGPDTIREIKDAEAPYPVAYTITYQISENLKNVIGTQQAVYDLSFSKGPHLEGTVDTAGFDGETLTLNLTLPAAQFEDGKQLASSAVLTIKVGNETYVVPSNVAVTEMSALQDFTITATAGAGGSITPSGPVTVTEGADQTFTMKANDGYHIAAVLINGDPIEIVPEYTFKNVNSNHTIEVRFEKNASPRPDTHDDDKDDGPVGPQLNKVDHDAYVTGYADGTVRPAANITRGEAATIFFRLLTEECRDSNVTTYNTFSDVNTGDWYLTAVSTMSRLGILKGRTADTFVPNAPITRAEFAAICARFDNSQVTASIHFSDLDGHWAKAEVERAAALGWIKGYEDGSFRPDQLITRAEAMTMINRILERQPETVHDLLPDMKRWSDNPETAWYFLDVQEATNSHDYQKTGSHEHWTCLNRDPDWSRYE